MKKVLGKRFVLGTFVTIISMCSSCVQVRRCEVVEAQAKLASQEKEVAIYTTEPIHRDYQETFKYEAIGSNITSFDKVLERIKSQARRDGCQALVHVKFYRHQLGTRKYGSSFPKIEATGIRFTD
jgi:predicted amidophosphoribosyltransferase